MTPELMIQDQRKKHQFIKELHWLFSSRYLGEPFTTDDYDAKIMDSIFYFDDEHVKLEYVYLKEDGHVIAIILHDHDEDIAYSVTDPDVIDVLSTLAKQDHPKIIPLPTAFIYKKEVEALHKYPALAFAHQFNKYSRVMEDWSTYLFHDKDRVYLRDVVTINDCLSPENNIEDQEHFVGQLVSAYEDHPIEIHPELKDDGIPEEYLLPF